MKKLVPLLLALLLLVAACGTGGKQSSDKSNGKLKVVTTNSILYDMAKMLVETTSIFIVLYLLVKILMNMKLNLKILKVN